MKFSPINPLGIRDGEKKLWEALKVPLANEPGLAYFGYTPRNENGSVIKESDVLIIHPEFGICVIECKGCRIDNIDKINGDEWLMKNWYENSMQPLKQADKAMWAVKGEIEKFIKIKIGRPLKINYSHLAALPFVTRQEWLDSGYGELAQVRGAVLLKEDLTPENIKQKLANLVRIQQSKISQEEWNTIWSFSTKKSKRKHIRNLTCEQDTIAKVKNCIQYESMIFDYKQKEIDSMYPEGPQRLRGLAGTGKTVLLARRAAKIHFDHPEWNIAFVFFTRSLYESIENAIAYAYRELLEESKQEIKDPDWSKLRILHSWGAKEKDGFYRNLTLNCGATFKSLNDVKSQLKTKYLFPDTAFRIVCDELEQSQHNIPVLFDAIIIDEGQDLPPSFYRLAYKTLTEPKRLYWAYDEAQGVNSLIVPDSASIFGRDERTNRPMVDLSGAYKGGASKSYIMSSCYRTPRLLLMTAHAINMGLFRKGGAIQGITNKENWQLLGYEVLAGDFRSEGKPITITRFKENSPHEIDKDDFKYESIMGSPLIAKSFDSEFTEQKWIAEQVANDIHVKGFDPNDIIITAPFSNYEKSFFKELKSLLEQKQVNVHLIEDDSRDVFQEDDCVTISNIYRAKGNEAWKVYVCRFEYGIKHLAHLKKGDSELHKRNEAFTALTRSKAWCVVTGQVSPIFDELDTAIKQYPEFTFPAFNKQSLSRNLEDESVNSDSEQINLNEVIQKPKTSTKHLLKLRAK